jgi:hypothetical protein
LKRGEYPPRQANSGLVEDPGFAPRDLFESPTSPVIGKNQNLHGGTVSTVTRRTAKVERPEITE